MNRERVPRQGDGPPVACRDPVPAGRACRDPLPPVEPVETRLDEWRTALATASHDLGIELDVGLSSRGKHPVDEFIDPDLSRHRLTWSDVDVLPQLETVATQVWQACERLADCGGADADAEAEMDAARVRYEQMYLAAQQLSIDSSEARATQARREGKRAGRREGTRQARPVEEARPAEQALSMAATRARSVARAGLRTLRGLSRR